MCPPHWGSTAPTGWNSGSGDRQGMNLRNGMSRRMNGDTFPGRDTGNRIWLNVLLFVLTAYTTTVAGVEMAVAMQVAVSPASFPGDLHSTELLWNPEFLVLGLPFSGTLLLILGIHEMGHYLTSRRWKVRATLPFFIPFPSLIGTLGAVIKIRSRIPNRRALMDIGASGPLAGFVVALLALIVGLHLSEIVPVSTFAQGGISLGNSILGGWLTNQIIGDLPDGFAIYDHPVFVAGWLGLFVTALNLMPVGQFDGGHIVYAFGGARIHALVSKAALVVLAGLWALGPPYDWLYVQDGVSTWLDSRWPGWLIWILIALALGRRHSPTGDPDLVLDPSRKLLGTLSFIIFLLCFVPRPISFSVP